MGSYMSFTRVSPEELDKAFAEPEWVDDFLDEIVDLDLRPEDPDGSLDKSWAGVQYLLDAAGVGVEFFMDGDPIDKECYLHGWSPETVAETARRLGEAPFERLAIHHDAERMDAENVYPRVWSTSPDGGLQELRETYEALVEFFADAAARGSGAIMSFSN